MTDPIAPLTPALPLASVRGAKAQAAAPVGAAADPSPFAAASAAPAAPAAPPPAPAQSPVALSVDRDPSGVFVYTLTDRGTGQVLAVIPRALTQSPTGNPGGEVDIQA